MFTFIFIYFCPWSSFLFLFFLQLVNILPKRISLCRFILLGNVLKEIVEPLGAVIHADAFELGDPTISMMELWGAEYQESDALLVQPEHRDLLTRICEREKVKT